MSTVTKMTDVSLLNPDDTKENVIEFLDEVSQYPFAAICVLPVWVKTAAEALKDRKYKHTKLCAAVSFPLGTTTPEGKALEIAEAIKNGAEEIDVVINIGALKGKEYDVVEEDMRAAVEAAEGKAIVKVIIEVGLLTDEDIVKACEIAMKTGVDFVKTCTGSAPGEANVENISLMKKVLSGSKVGAKAAGGVTSLEIAEKLVEAGATRFGTGRKNGLAIAREEAIRVGSTN